MANQAQVAAIYASLQLQTAQFKAAFGEAIGEIRKFSAQTRAEMREAQGSIALLSEQIGVVLPRHLRTFVAGLPGVSSAMSAAFNAVAVIALADVIIKAGEKVAEFAEKTHDAGEKNRAAWDKSTGGLKLQSEELELSNIKIENQIAKLEKKPQNNLAQALLEAKVEAGQLAEKLQSANTEALNLLKTQSTGLMGSLLTGKSGTGYEQTMLTQHMRWLGQQTDTSGQLRESQSFGQSLQTPFARFAESAKP